MTVEVVALDGFDDPRLSDADLASSAGGDSVFTTRAWQCAWWEAFGRGIPLPLLALRGGEPVAYAPFFAEAGMVFLVGSGGSDYLDLVGDVSDPEVLTALLSAAREATPDFVGLRLYHVPDASKTGAALASVAEGLDLAYYDEGSLPAPFLDLSSPEAADAAVNKKSLVRKHRRMERDGDLEFHHLTEADEILPLLDGFFAQHIERWDGSDSPSLFLDPAQRRFYELLTHAGSRAGWLRFGHLTWNGESVGFHFGTHYSGSYLWYKPTFSLEHAHLSPGEVLMRSLMLAARAEGAKRFDFGLGDEAFKDRFATGVEKVRTWGLYPVERS